MTDILTTRLTSRSCSAFISRAVLKFGKEISHVEINRNKRQWLISKMEGVSESEGMGNETGRIKLRARHNGYSSAQSAKEAHVPAVPDGGAGQAAMAHAAPAELSSASRSCRLAEIRGSSATRGATATRAHSDACTQSHASSSRLVPHISRLSTSVTDVEQTSNPRRIVRSAPWRMPWDLGATVLARKPRLSPSGALGLPCVGGGGGGARGDAATGAACSSCGSVFALRT